MRWSFPVFEAGLVPAMSVPTAARSARRRSPEPVGSFFLLFRESEPCAPVGRSALIDPFWRSPAVILRGWKPRRPWAPRPAPGRTVGAALVAAVDRLLDWQDRARSRRMLLALDERMLKDIGIDRAFAQEEGSLPFWRQHR